MAAIAVVLVATVLAATGCSAGRSAARLTGNRPEGGIATVAGVVGAWPNWIFPFGSLPYYNTANYQDFIDLMYRPLYLFGGNNDSVTVNYSLSTATAPVYRDGGRVVLISLKRWKWSDGEQVDAADVVFWLNMDEAEKQNWPGYMKGGIPDNLVSYHSVGRHTVVLDLTRPYASTWFTYNELAQITPMPLAWDITRIGAAPGSGGCAQDTAADHWARCRAVYEFLTTEAKDLHTYTATSPLWSVADGPWRLRSFSIAANVTLVPNRQYSGWPRPALAALRFVSYSSDAAAFAALRAGQVDVAVIPQQDLPPRAAGSLLPAKNSLGRAFYLQPVYNFGINYYDLDFQDQRDSALFSQLYFRQALQELTNQQAIIRISYGGYAIPTTGGVPNMPRSGWISADMTANKGAGLYPYDPARAETLLAAHGWSVVNGTLTCERPGDLPSECGAGVGRGRTANLGFAAAWSDGPAQPSQSPMGIVRTDLAAAGIRVSVSYPVTLIGPAPCAAPDCSAAMQYVGGWEFDGPGYAPTGEPLFQTDASWNLGLYSSAQMNSLISAAQTSNRRSAFHAYANYTATQLPVIWLPDPYSVVAVSQRLREVAQSPLSSFYPEYWYFTSASRRSR